MTTDNSFSFGRRKLLTGLSAALGTVAIGFNGATLLAQPVVGQPDNRVAKPSIIVFDVNETLIDIESIGPLFERVFGDRRVVREWFNQLVLYSDAVTLSGFYVTFFTLAQGVLEMLGTIYKVPVRAGDVEELRTRMLSMTAHKDSAEGLRMLKEAGFRLITLTNSPPDPKGSPLEHAGLSHFIERQFSIDAVRRFKPAPQAYHMVAELLDVPPSAICLVAAHTWDTMGAQSVGLSAGLVARPGNAVLPVHGLPQPQAVASDLPGVARQLIALWR
ncbi:haloacid dehalogenase type II [Granulicella sp. L60]|uniref:haloacid dehalogenase type II n=1 Tax=Granulicella sp. L60 TaxID=1641866 RepID=UPI00131DC7EB|nr:haloacid dehalogenase type II [Granulicella sp. L60]